MYRFLLLAAVMSVIGLISCNQERSPKEHSGEKLQVEESALAKENIQIPSDPWTASQLIKPEELAKLLSDSRGEKPLVLHVGYSVLYRSAHIPGAKHIGPASEPAGVNELKKEAQNLSRNKEIVVYCGCCPWKDCPNIRPAFKTMQEMGFTKVKVLYLPNNFPQDWINKGFPVEKGG